jgi:hypothetical protein
MTGARGQAGIRGPTGAVGLKGAVDTSSYDVLMAKVSVANASFISTYSLSFDSLQQRIAGIKLAISNLTSAMRTYADTLPIYIACCEACPVGYFCPLNGTNNPCSASRPGFFCPPSSLNGFLSMAVQAPKGYYTGVTGLTAPLACPAGSYSSSPMASTCYGMIF